MNPSERAFRDRILAENHATYRSSRADLLALARVNAEMYREDPNQWVARLNSAPDGTTIKLSVSLAHWYQTGLQSVEMSHKLAAALMATHGHGTLDKQRMPWPCFEIIVPPGLLPSSTGEVNTIIVSETPMWMPITRAPNVAGIVVVYCEDVAVGHMALRDLAEVGSFEPEAHENELGNFVSPYLRDMYDQPQENRTRIMIMRLIAGVVLLINTARADKPESYPQHPLRPAKRDKPRANLHRLVRSITIDCRASVRSFVLGESRDSPHVTSLVRGHWRQQAHGPRHTLRRTTWIEPFWRGDGPLAERTIRLREPDAREQAKP